MADFRGVPEPELLLRRGLFVAEGREVVRRLLMASRFRTHSLLATRTALQTLGEVLDPVTASFPVYECDLPTVKEIVGFNIHRGCLALGERPPEPDLAGILKAGRLVVILEAVGNADNTGGVFRNALAFGADAVLLSPTCCDPLYRKAIRTSMGAVFRVPFKRLAVWPAGLDDVKRAGFLLIALTPRASARDLDQSVRILARGRRLALLIGNEGHGLTSAAEEKADEHVRISMSDAVDSLNLSTAAGIALHSLTQTG